MTSDHGKTPGFILRDGDYFRRRAAEARRAASSKEASELVNVQGDLALAYAALARRRAITPEGA